MDKYIDLSVKCPHCGQSFMDEDHHVNGHPGIKVHVESKKQKGILWLCPLYGCFKHESTIEIKENEIVTMSCPYCNHTLVRDILCKSCQAPVVGFNINIGGKVNICSRKGCQNHYILFEDLDDMMNLFYEKFEPRK